MDGLSSERLLDALHRGHVLGRVGQLFVLLRMRAHIVQAELLRVLAFPGGNVLQETIADSVVDPVTDVMQARGISVDFAIAIPDIYHILGKQLIRLMHRLDQLGQQYHLFP